MNGKLSTKRNLRIGFERPGDCQKSRHWREAAVSTCLTVTQQASQTLRDFLASFLSPLAFFALLIRSQKASSLSQILVEIKRKPQHISTSSGWGPKAKTSKSNFSTTQNSLYLTSTMTRIKNTWWLLGCLVSLILTPSHEEFFIFSLTIWRSAT